MEILGEIVVSFCVLLLLPDAKCRSQRLLLKALQQQHCVFHSASFLWLMARCGVKMKYHEFRRMKQLLSKGWEPFFPCCSLAQNPLGERWQEPTAMRL